MLFLQRESEFTWKNKKLRVVMEKNQTGEARISFV
mgnify:CR=1 FL=1